MRRWTTTDAWMFRQGRHDRLHEVLGAFLYGSPKGSGAIFRAWVPDVDAVSVVGEFNDWDTDAHPMTRLDGDVWEVRVLGAEEGQTYKLRVHGIDGVWRDRADPFAAWNECPPRTASVLVKRAYRWHDDGFVRRRPADPQAAPISIYEVHLGSWAARVDLPDGPLFRTAAEPLAEHVAALGFTHVELMPVMEHPYGPSWGYQVTGYFAPTARWGSPTDLQHLVDTLHRHGIGVVLDWVPAHFPTDDHGLYRFHGGAVFEHPDPRRGWHPDWTTGIFDYGRPEVRSFLLSSAACWLDRFHADGLRVDAVSSMLYLDYSRAEGEWLPNEHGERENLDAIQLFRDLAGLVREHRPHALLIAEESTSFGGVTAPPEEGGLGFHLKWDMGWMNDRLRFLARDPIHRRHHHDEFTFRGLYQDSERWVLPLSHDEVVHGKGSLLNKMPGDRWQQLANVRLLLADQYAQRGKPLLFMGSELAPEHEWGLDAGIDWAGLRAHADHAGIERLVARLNAVLRAEPALHEGDARSDGFDWITCDDRDRGVVAWLRWDTARERPVAVVLNLTPEPRRAYRIGLPFGGSWTTLLDTDQPDVGGAGHLHHDAWTAEDTPADGLPASVVLDVPPLGALYLGRSR